jgi:hypothetical protein
VDADKLLKFNVNPALLLLLFSQHLLLFNLPLLLFNLLNQNAAVNLAAQLNAMHAGIQLKIWLNLPWLIQISLLPKKFQLLIPLITFQMLQTL